MKKLNVLFLALGFAFMLNSCSKSEEYQNVALAQTINQNTSYTFELPFTDDGYAVTTEAKNASISLIGIGATGNPVYTYTPNIDFVGTDLIVLTTSDKHGKGHEKGRKKGHRNHDNDNDNDNDDNDNDDNDADEVNHNNYNGMGKGKCGTKNKETEDDYIVTINITVLPATPTL